MSIRSSSYPACKMHEPFCHFGLSDFTIFVHTFSQNGTIFRKTVAEIKCVILFPLQLWSEIFPILRRFQRNIIINVVYSLFLSDFNEALFRKILKYEILWKHVQWETNCSVVSCAVPVGNVSWMLFQEGRSSTLRLRRGVEEAAHTRNNPRTKCTGVYCI